LAVRARTSVRRTRASACRCEGRPLCRVPRAAVCRGSPWDARVSRDGARGLRKRMRAHDCPHARSPGFVESCGSGCAWKPSPFLLLVLPEINWARYILHPHANARVFGRGVTLHTPGHRERVGQPVCSRRHAHTRTHTGLVVWKADASAASGTRQPGALSSVGVWVGMGISVHAHIPAQPLRDGASTRHHVPTMCSAARSPVVLNTPHARAHALAHAHARADNAKTFA